MTEQAQPLRWIVPVAYAVSANLLFAIPLAAGSGDADGSGPLGWIETASFVALCILFVANILECAILTARDVFGLRAFSRRTMLMMKLGLIPFFLFGGLIMLFFMVLSIHPVLAVAGWISLPIAAAFGWLIRWAAQHGPSHTRWSCAAPGSYPPASAPRMWSCSCSSSPT